MISLTIYPRVGELVQGRLTPTDHFIIPGLASQYFQAKIELKESDEASDIPDRALEAVHLFFQYQADKNVDEISKFTNSKEQGTELLKEKGLHLTFETNIPYGKGFTTQSIEVLSVLKILSDYYNQAIDKDTLYQIGAKVTIIDPCLEKEVNQIFDPINGKTIFHLPDIKFKGLFFDCNPEKVNNPEIIYDRIDLSELEMKQYASIMEFYQMGLINNDFKSIFEATWKSAQINEIFNKKMKLGVLKEYADANEVGVFVSHVGSYIGIYGKPVDVNGITDDFKTFVKRFWDTEIYETF